MEKPVHEYAAELVAPDAASFREFVDDRQVVDLKDLTPGERTILDAAVSGGYHEETASPSAAWDRLLARLPATDVPDRHYVWYVEYEGESYELELDSYEACR